MKPEFRGPGDVFSAQGPQRLTRLRNAGLPRQGWGAIVPRACLRPLRRLGPDGEIQRKPRGLGFKTRKLAGPGEAAVAGQGDLTGPRGGTAETP